MDFIEILVSFIGGSLVATILTLWQTSNLERERKRIEVTQQQLQNLYGPLYFFATCNRELIKLSNTLLSAWNLEYGERIRSKEISEETLPLLDSSDQAIDIVMEYFEQIYENSTQMFTLLTKNYPLIEPDDAKVFTQFIIDYIRFKTESNLGKIKTPGEIYKHLGEINIAREELLTLINTRFQEKNDAIKSSWIRNWSFNSWIESLYK